MNVLIFNFTSSTATSGNPSPPAQFPAVHFHVLFCSIVFIQYIVSHRHSQSSVTSSTNDVWSALPIVGYFQTEKENIYNGRNTC